MRDQLQRLTLVALLLLSASSVGAQTATTRTAEVVASGRFSIEIPATSASMSLSVQSTGRTPALAGENNEQATSRLRAALRALGLPNDSVVTREYSMRLQVDYETKDTGYVASNTVRVTTRNLDLVSRIIGTALVSGATDVDDLTFHADDPERAYLDALRAATDIARRRATVLAEAAGGKLGILLGTTAGEPQATPYSGPVRLNAVQANIMGGPTRVSIQAPVVNVNAVVSMRYTVVQNP